MPDKVRENRARRRAARRGLALHKSGRRDPQALDFNRYQLFDPSTGAMIFQPQRDGFTYCATLAEVERWLDGETPKQPHAKEFRANTDAAPTLQTEGATG